MIRENLESLRKELPPETCLVAVSKFHPAEAVVEAYEAGQRVFGESRPQELESKALALAGRCPGIEWHFIGHLQTNKLKMVLPYCALVESIDSRHLLKAVSEWGVANGKRVDVLLELHIGAEQTKQGFTEEEALDVLFDAESFPGVRFRGLMGMASNTEDEGVVDADFERLDSFMSYCCELFPELEAFDQLSAGMSGDWRIALRHGSTTVRIGTFIFGQRV